VSTSTALPVEPAPTTLKDTLVKLAGPAIVVFLFAAALWALTRTLQGFSYADLQAGLSGIPAWSLAAALGLTALNYVVLSGYDFLALKTIKQPLPYRRIAFASFIGYVFTNVVGLSFLGAGAVRYRVYTGYGLSAKQIARVVALCGLTLWTGLLTLAGAIFLIAPQQIPALPQLPALSWRPLGALFLGLVAVYLLCAKRGKALRIWRWELPLPPLHLALGQVAFSATDWLLSSLIFFLLLPSAPGVSFLLVLTVFVVAMVAGIVSHVPGGVGVFEAIVMTALTPALDPSQVLGALVAFRVVYYLCPLVAAVLLLGRHELRQRESFGKVAAVAESWFPGLVPHAAAFVAYLGGGVLLVSGAVPALRSRLDQVNEVLPLFVSDTSHFFSVMTGALLILLAHALQRRLRAAYVAVSGMLVAGIVLSLLKDFAWEEALILTVLLAALLPQGRHFYRRSRLTSQSLSWPWALNVVVMLGGWLWLGTFAYQHVAYDNSLWWTFGADAPRALRAALACGSAILIVLTARMLRPARLKSLPTAEADLDDAAAAVAASGSSSAGLALLGDKSLLFNDEREGFVMYAVEGRTWVSMGEPVAATPEAKADLLWRFREACDAYGANSVFYQVPAEQLPYYLDLGLSLVKFGEEARVPLEEFTLKGKAGKRQRKVRNTAQRAGWSFEVLPPGSSNEHLAELQEISDAWLADKNTKEKGFSLGFFDADYLARFPLAVVRHEGRILAFANVWASGQQNELSVDLMRYRPDGPPGTMNYLFLELMLHGQGSGYRWFNLGMAPFSGLEDRTHAPLWGKFGNFLYSHGEEFYNFQGLREFKERFKPVWEPKYIAYPPTTPLPVVLAALAKLTSGGLRGVVSK
jgi:phosphatidylglycerol lysyltransferase